MRFPHLARDGSSQFVVSLGFLAPEAFIGMGLLDAAVPSTSERAGFRTIWQGLKAENAPLRVFRDGSLVSAPIDFFDALILSHATVEWQRWSRLAGDVFATENHDYRQIWEPFISGRLRALVESGRLELRGKPQHSDDTMNYEVRLSSQP
jgi:hypothetical protein